MLCRRLRQRMDLRRLEGGHACAARRHSQLPAYWHFTGDVDGPTLGSDLHGQFSERHR